MEFLAAEEKTSENLELPKETFQLQCTKRHKEWSVEIPHLKRSDIFVKTASKIIPSALEECLPEVRRKRTTVSFVPSITQADGKGNVNNASGRSSFNKSQREIEVSIQDIELAKRFHPEVGWHIQVLRTLLHELFEEDYVTRSDLYGGAIRKKLSDPDYREAEHELTADGRAIRQLKINLGCDYGIDENGLVYINQSNFPRLRRL